MKTIAELNTELARREGKKYESTIGNIREQTGIACDLIYESNPEEPPANNELAAMLWKNGKRRAQRKRAK